MKDHELSTLSNKVTADTSLKEIIVNHVGQKLNPEGEEVTVEMVIDVMSEEFPELILCISEENWIRGYHQGLADVDEGRKYLEENEELHTK